jgi:dolichyl-phosphate beta-glucosyltransferase
MAAENTPADPHAASVSISVIIPALNEVQRLPPYLASIRVCLDAQYAGNYEVIVVDDGSTDGTGDMLRSMAAECPQLRVLRHTANQGKGAAVRTGMLEGRGELLLFADADGATPIEEQRRLRQAIQNGADVAIGSRMSDAEDVTRQRTWFRGLVGSVFARVARGVLRLPVRDTQCGFKMFRRDCGYRIFELAQEKRFLFDLELLVLAHELGYRITEVPVNWSDVPGSRLNMLRESRRILAGLWRLRRRAIKLHRACS